MTSDEVRYLAQYFRAAAEDGGEVGPEKLLRAADALEATLPEEREGRCWCSDGWGCTYGHEWADEYAGIVLDEAECHCRYCGAHLGPDGIARRNPDAALVERVRDLVAEGEAAYPLDIWPEPEQVAPDSDLAKHGERCAAAMARRVYGRIKEALDEPSPVNQPTEPVTRCDPWETIKRLWGLIGGVQLFRGHPPSTYVVAALSGTFSGETPEDAVRAALDGLAAGVQPEPTPEEVVAAVGSTPANQWHEIRTSNEPVWDDVIGCWSQYQPPSAAADADDGHHCDAPGDPCDGCDYEARSRRVGPCDECKHGPVHTGIYPCQHTKRTGFAALYGALPTEDTEQEIAAGLAALRGDDADTERLDTLERMVHAGGVVQLQPACTCEACGGWVLMTVDGRCTHDGPVPRDLRAALDRAKDGESNG